MRRSRPMYLRTLIVLTTASISYDESTKNLYQLRSIHHGQESFNEFADNYAGTVKRHNAFFQIKVFYRLHGGSPLVRRSINPKVRWSENEIRSASPKRK